MTVTFPKCLRFLFAWLVLTCTVLAPPALGLIDLRIWVALLIAVICVYACRDSD